MPVTQRNPFARTVTRNAMKGTETVVTVIENGMTPRTIGEFITFVPNEAETTDNVPVGGQSGNIATKVTGYTKTWTATFYEGTDGNYWEQMHIDKKRGNERPIEFMTSDKDDSARDVGEAIRAYKHCILTTFTRSGMTQDARKVVTIGGTFEDYDLVQGFNVIQGQ